MYIDVVRGVAISILDEVGSIDIVGDILVQGEPLPKCSLSA